MIFLTGPFTITDPQDQEIGKFYVVRERRMTDFEASNCIDPLEILHIQPTKCTIISLWGALSLSHASYASETFRSVRASEIRRSVF